jgi:hypothetical protein
MTAIFYLTIVLLWTVIVSITRHALCAANVHAIENSLCPMMSRKVRQTIVVTSLIFGSIIHLWLSHIYTLHQLVVGA